MEQVMLKCPQVHNRITVLKPAEVVSRRGNTLRVKIIGEVGGVREVDADSVTPAKQVFGQPNVNFGRPVTLPIQCFPSSPHALGNRFR